MVPAVADVDARAEGSMVRKRRVPVSGLFAAAGVLGQSSQAGAGSASSATSGGSTRTALRTSSW
jgi:hypothetical protein